MQISVFPHDLRTAARQLRDAAHDAAGVRSSLHRSDTPDTGRADSAAALSFALRELADALAGSVLRLESLQAGVQQATSGYLQVDGQCWPLGSR